MNTNKTYWTTKEIRLPYYNDELIFHYIGPVKIFKHNSTTYTAERTYKYVLQFPQILINYTRINNKIGGKQSYVLGNSNNFYITEKEYNFILSNFLQEIKIKS